MPCAASIACRADIVMEPTDFTSKGFRARHDLGSQLPFGHVLPTTPSSNAFRPRHPTTPFGHAFRPRLSVTPSGHVIRCAIWIEDVMFLVTAILPASVPLADTVVLELVDDVVDRHEGHVDDIHPHIEIRRHGNNTSTSKRPKPFHSCNFSSSLRPLKLRSLKSGKKLWGTRNFTVRTLTICVQGLDAAKHRARSNSMAK